MIFFFAEQRINFKSSIFLLVLYSGNILTMLPSLQLPLSNVWRSQQGQTEREFIPATALIKFVEIVTRPAERVNEFPYWNRKHTNAPEVQKEKNYCNTNRGYEDDLDWYINNQIGSEKNGEEVEGHTKETLHVQLSVGSRGPRSERTASIKMIAGNECVHCRDDTTAIQSTGAFRRWCLI
jgi:hypothetical protein